jgi:hypothetical protein
MPLHPLRATPRRPSLVVAIAAAAAAAGAAAGIIPAAAAVAAPVIDDTFESTTNTNYTVVNDGTPDGTYNFHFDYAAAGIPTAPHSAVGDTHGLKFTVNDTQAVEDALTAFHNTAVSDDHYKLTVDVYMHVAGTGTTEMAHTGVGGDGTTFNSIFTPISGSGSFMSMTGDGGSASDYRWYLDGSAGGPTTVASGDPSYLDPAHTTNNTGALYQSIFPSTNGVPTNLWTTLSIDVDNTAGQITYSVDDTPIIQGAFTPGALKGQVSLGLTDPFGASIDSPAGSVYTVYDNLKVEPVPEPASVGSLAVIALAAATRRRGRGPRRSAII